MKNYNKLIIIIVLNIFMFQNIYSNNLSNYRITDKNYYTQSNESKNSTIIPIAKPKKRYIIFFGNILFGCHGFGICGIAVIEGTAKNNSGEIFSAIATITERSDGSLEFFFNNNDVNDYVKKTYLGDNQFIIKDDYTLDTDVVSKISVKNSNITIKKGNYTLKRVKDGYTIIFK